MSRGGFRRTDERFWPWRVSLPVTNQPNFPPGSDQPSAMPQFRLRSLFSSVTVLAVLCWIPVACRGCYYQERNAIAQLLANYPDIENVSIIGFDDGLVEEIVITSFTIRGRPNTFVSVSGLEDAWNGSFRHLDLNRIGSLTFTVGGYGHRGMQEIETGNPVKSHFWKNAVDVGPDTEFIDVLPFTIATLDELIERYDEVEAYFRTWPTANDPGTHKHSDGIERYYFVETAK
jgi:hypothetical protein